MIHMHYDFWSFLYGYLMACVVREVASHIQWK